MQMVEGLQPTIEWCLGLLTLVPAGSGTSVHEQFLLSAFSSTWLKYLCLSCTQTISTTVHAMTKSFVPFCSAQDGESTDMNCLEFWAYCENDKILMKRQVYIIRGFSPILGIFSYYEILISLECAVNSEWNGIINFLLSCSVVKLFNRRNYNNPAFNFQQNNIDVVVLWCSEHL